LWLAHSPDLNICDFYLWESVNQKDRSNPHTIEEMNEGIQKVIFSLFQELQCININFYGDDMSACRRRRALPASGVFGL
jgi:hypothetical protein